MTFLGSELRDQTRLDSIITLIDAENFDDVVLDTEVGRAQVIYGDILLLNKCDLVSKERLEAVEQQLRDVKNDARILRSVKGDVPLPLLLSVGHGGRCCHLAACCGKRSEALVPELSLEFCATVINCVQ